MRHVLGMRRVSGMCQYAHSVGHLRIWYAKSTLINLFNACLMPLPWAGADEGSISLGSTVLRDRDMVVLERADGSGAAEVLVAKTADTADSLYGVYLYTLFALRRIVLIGLCW